MNVDVTHHSAVVNGVRLHWVERGVGPLVVLLHGFPEFWWTWRHQLGPIAGAGYRAVALDLRGYNESEQRGPYDIDTLANDVRALIEHLGARRAVIIGHDWGGGLAWHFAATHPSHCAAVAVLNAPHPALFQKSLRSNPRQIARSWYMFFFLLPWLPEWFCRWRGLRWLRPLYETGEPAHFTPHELEPIFSAIARPGALSTAIDYYRTAVLRGLRHAAAFQHYPVICAPALLIWGMKDRWLDFDALVPGLERWAPSVEIERIANAHHFVHLECVEQVNAKLLEFLARQTHSESN